MCKIRIRETFENVELFEKPSRKDKAEISGSTHRNVRRNVLRDLAPDDENGELQLLRTHLLQRDLAADDVAAEEHADVALGELELALLLFLLALLQERDEVLGAGIWRLGLDLDLGIGIGQLRRSRSRRGMERPRRERQILQLEFRTVLFIRRFKLRQIVLQIEKKNASHITRWVWTGNVQIRA